MKRRASDLPVEYCKTSRRMFLKGVGATATALPFLPSLVAEPAAALDSGFERVVFIVWHHGLFQRHWYPTGVPLSQVEPGVRAGPLSEGTLGMYMNPALNDLADKITILRGVSQLAAWGHSTPSALTASSFKHDKVAGEPIVGTYPDSVDNVLARSPQVYPQLSADQVDVLRLTLNHTRYNHSIRDFQTQPMFETSRAAFDRMFPYGVNLPDVQPTDAGPSPEQKRARRQLLMIDRALDEFRRLRDGGRLSSLDRQRLEQTMEHYYELESRLRNQADGSSSTVGLDPQMCQDFTVGDGNRPADHVQLITMGFACGVSRIAYWRQNSSHADTDGAHHANSAANMEPTGLYTSLMREACRNTADLLRAMDAITEGNGRTMLDNSLVLLTSDLGSSCFGGAGHTGVDAPFLFGGTLGGKFRSGELIDYTDYGEAGHFRTISDYELRGGPPHNEMFISLMRGFGLDPSEWEVNGEPGFGSYVCNRAEDCDPVEHPNRVQGYYARYYEETHAPANPPGTELPYWRLGER